MFYVNI